MVAAAHVPPGAGKSRGAGRCEKIAWQAQQKALPGLFSVFVFGFVPFLRVGSMNKREDIFRDEAKKMVKNPQGVISK